MNPKLTVLGYTIAYGNLSTGFTMRGFYSDIGEALTQAGLTGGELVTLYEEG